MDKVRGKWFVCWWDKRLLNPDYQVIAVDFDTKEKGHEWILTQERYNPDHCDVRYHETIEECLVIAQQKEIQSSLEHGVASYQILEWLRQVPEASDFVQVVDASLKAKKPRWRKLLETYPNMGGWQAWNNVD